MLAIKTLRSNVSLPSSLEVELTRVFRHSVPVLRGGCGGGGVAGVWGAGGWRAGGGSRLLREL